MKYIKNKIKLGQFKYCILPRFFLYILCSVNIETMMINNSIRKHVGSNTEAVYIISYVSYVNKNTCIHRYSEINNITTHITF